MRTALYYPHTEIKKKSLIHASLFLWDNIETIVPWRGYSGAYSDPETARAMELIGRPRTPTMTEKKKVHELVEDLIRDGVPETFQYAPRHLGREREREYEIWPQKLLHETWHMLWEAGLTERRLSYQDYPMSQAAGLSLMAILADVLAGETRARITDRALAYATIANAPKTTHAGPSEINVIPLTLKGIAVDRLSFRRLIEFREREEREHAGSDYRALRHKYLEAIEKHIRAISEYAPDSADRMELDRAFRSDMETDLRDLKREIGFGQCDALLTKDVVALVLGGAAIVATGLGMPNVPLPEAVTGAGLAVSLVGGLSASNKLAKSRHEILRKHPMAYLYEIGG